MIIQYYHRTHLTLMYLYIPCTNLVVVLCENKHVGVAVLNDPIMLEDSTHKGSQDCFPTWTVDPLTPKSIAVYEQYSYKLNTQWFTSNGE